jgi:hypothetical protein
MPSVRAGKYDVRRAGGFEAYLRENHGLLDDVSLVRTKDGGMHGNRIFVFETGDGERIEIGGYVSQPPVPTYSMSVFGDRAETLFGDD